MIWLHRLFTYSGKTNTFDLNSIRYIFLLMPFLLFFQNCADDDVQFSEAPEQVSAASQTPPEPVVPPQVACNANQGQICDKGTTRMVSGCQEGYICADFIGIYYNSPGGCDRSPGSSWIEYSFDGTSEWAHGSSNPEGTRLGDYSSTYHCTYVGNGTYDPFHNIPNGTCFNSSAAGYSIPNTWTRVVRGDGCVTTQHTVVPGKIQCDGSCE